MSKEIEIPEGCNDCSFNLGDNEDDRAIMCGLYDRFSSCKKKKPTWCKATKVIIKEKEEK